MSLDKSAKEVINKDFGIHENDTGSMPVQIATLTSRISMLTVHMQKNKQDFSCKKSLLKIIARRRIYLEYLHRVDKAQYQDVIKRLGLKDKIRAV